MQGKGGVRRGLRHDGGRMRRVEGEKLEGESCWKSGEGRTRLYIWLRVWLAVSEITRPLQVVK
jgi:hypothetical protein